MHVVRLVKNTGCMCIGFASKRPADRIDRFVTGSESEEQRSRRGSDLGNRIGEPIDRSLPDLVVEVRSLAKPEYDTRDKRHVYARCGVPFYWMVDPQNKTLTELQLVERDYARVAECQAGDTFAPRLFAGLTVEVDSLWRIPR